MARAIALPFVDRTHNNERGTVQGLCWYTFAKEREGVEGGKDRQDQ